MKKIIMNAIKIASKAMNKKGATTAGTVVASGVLGFFGILSRPEEAVVDTSDFATADSDSVTETIEHTPSRQSSEDNDFILVDEAEVVQEEVEEVEEEQEQEQEEVEEIQEEVQEEVEEVETVETQNLAPENNTVATQATQQATQQTTQHATQPVNNNTGQEARETEARRAEAARQEEAEAQKRAEAAARKAAEEEAARKAAEEAAARKAAEEAAARKAAEEASARQAEQAKRVAASHNKPNVLLRNGNVVAEGTGRVWYYNGPVEGLSYTDSSGNVKSGRVNSVRVNADYVGEDGINYSSYTNGRMAPVVIQQTDGGYILHMFGR